MSRKRFDASAYTPWFPKVKIMPPPTLEETKDEVHRKLEEMYSMKIDPATYEYLGHDGAGQFMVRWLNRTL